MSTLAQFFRKLQTKDIIWTDEYLSRTPFHPGYWVRVRIDAALASHAKLAHGVLLDIGCGNKPFEKIFEPFIDSYIGLEYSPESGYRGNKADFCGDAAFLPLADESIDTIICTEVMEHVPNPEKTVEEFHRVLRPGGTVITTAPFVYPVHDNWDFFRYAPEGLAVIMKRKGLEVQETKPLSGGGVTMAIMLNLYWYELGFMWTKWLYPVGLIIRPLLLFFVFCINILGRLADMMISSPQMSFNHLTIGRKN